MKQSLIATLAFALLASVAVANDHGPGGPPPPGDFGRGPEGEAIVGSDGSLYIVKTTETAGNGTAAVTPMAAKEAVSITAIAHMRAATGFDSIRRRPRESRIDTRRISSCDGCAMDIAANGKPRRLPRQRTI